MCRNLYLKPPRRFASQKRSSGDVDIRAGPVNLALDFFSFSRIQTQLGGEKTPREHIKSRHTGRVCSQKADGFSGNRRNYPSLISS